MDEGPPVFVITGQLAAGKSTLAKALLDRFPLGLHVDVDGVREMVSSGLAGPLEWTDETTRQFGLAMRASAAIAAIYQPAGFAVAIEGGMDPREIQDAVGAADLGDHFIGIVLHPNVDVALKRNRDRTNKAFDTAVLDNVIHEIDAGLAADVIPPGWTRIDNGDETLDETVARVLDLRPISG